MRSFTPAPRMRLWRLTTKPWLRRKRKSPPKASMNEWKDGLSQIYIGKGNALLRLKRNAEAIEAYNQSAVLASNPGLAYFNVCAVLYNIGNTHESAAACRKCVQADPTRANAWFVLGSDLFADSPVSTRQGRSLGRDARGAGEVSCSRPRRSSRRRHESHAGDAQQVGRMLTAAIASSTRPSPACAARSSPRWPSGCLRVPVPSP